jgi:peptidyl-prolyl cis-trans isomerase D
MANNPSKNVSPAPTKKHLARLQREQMWRRWLIIGTTVVVVLVVGVLLYGLVLQSYIQARQPVAIVDNQKITTSQWQEHTRFQRANLINNAQQTYQFAQAFNDPSFQSQFVSQLQQIKTQLDPNTTGKQVLDMLVEDIVIRSEAAKRGITVSDEEVQRAFADVFGYFPNGTPTSEPTLASIPTSTLSSLQLTLIPPTATPQPTAAITTTETVIPTSALPTATEIVLPTATEVANPTPTPQPTPTANKVEGSGAYKNTVDTFNTSYGLSESQFRTVLLELLRGQLYRDRLQKSVLDELDLSRTTPEVWAHHILVADEGQAKDIYERLQKGEDFCKLAAEFSTDTSNKDKCGDLGWFGKGKMDQAFEDAAFALKVGEISQPVKSEFGYHIIQSLGNEERPISDSDFQTLQTTKFTEWLDARKAEHKIEIRDSVWQSRLPTTPAWPAALDDFIAQIQQQSQQPVQATPAP